MEKKVGLQKKRRDPFSHLFKEAQISNFSQSQKDESNDLPRSSWDFDSTIGVSPFFTGETSLVFFCSNRSANSYIIMGTIIKSWLIIKLLTIILKPKSEKKNREIMNLLNSGGDWTRKS